MSTVLFVLSLVLAYVHIATGETWIMLPQWACIIGGYAIIASEIIEGKRQHREFMAKYREQLKD